MAGTQELPSWLTRSTVVITNSIGQPVATSTTLLELPLTYYGPSIPLGTNGVWTYGGLTPPASSTSSTPTPTTTSSTTTSTFTSASTSSPTSTSTITTASATPFPFSASSTLSTGAIIGIIIGAIAGFILLLFLLICFVRLRSRRLGNQPHQTPIWTHWEVVSPSAPQTDEERPAGVGSPRDSGEEADSFLRRSRSAIDGSGHAGSSVRHVASLPPGAAPPQIVGSTGSGGSGHTSSSAVTDYGILLPGGGPIGQAYHDDSHFPARPSSEVTGYIIPPGELSKIDDEEEPSDPPRMYGVQHTSDLLLHEAFAPLLPPPPLDIDRLSARNPSLNENEKSVRSLSYPASDLEDPKVYTARRVKVKELGPRSPTEEAMPYSDDGPVPGPSTWRDSLGLSSISRLRKSWLGGSSSRNTSKSSGGRIRADDADVNQSLLSAPRVRSRVGLGLTIEGDRPMSSVSTKSAVSGNTVYHDAVSRLGTPVSVPSRALTPASARCPGCANEPAPPLPTGAPPAYAFSDPYDSLGIRGIFPHSQRMDVLDLPVPQPAPSFSASGGTSAATRNVASPPGLGGSNVRVWRDSLSVITGSSNNPSVTIDALDAEPPTAGEGWRSMASLHVTETGEQRATFGTPQIVHQSHPMLSDQGSLHSMNSLLSPFSHSSGSAPISSKHSHVLSGSNSSRPSAHSRVQTASSGSVRSGSLSSFGRRRGGPVSPSVSAFGGTIESGRLSVLEELPSPVTDGPNRVSVLGPMPSFANSTTAPTIRSVGATTTSDDTDVTRTTGTTMTVGTEATSLNKDSREGNLSTFQLGAFDFERVRI
ncbi:hypothetical protein EV363DRAFT_1586728 [Boletus edulis]|uniref:Uncharacterized protein n=1 Tax=Boletus edulis BED1 TaxID=1328754 RepID=A0AAD4BWK1_BOLED|nr:hypothetical protein EV363DRAFT_1586728 [Boletus edulis]KAF8442066.1 hypothetical protein L210DRAFT_3620794 [Boletus edulis BED1]